MHHKPLLDSSIFDTHGYSTSATRTSHTLTRKLSEDHLALPAMTSPARLQPLVWLEVLSARCSARNERAPYWRKKWSSIEASKSGGTDHGRDKIRNYCCSSMYRVGCIPVCDLPGACNTFVVKPSGSGLLIHSERTVELPLLPHMSAERFEKVHR